MASFLSARNTAATAMAAPARTGSDCRWKCSAPCVMRSATPFRSAAGSWPRTVSRTATRSRMPPGSGWNSPGRGWISCPCRAAGNSRTPSSPRSARRSIPIPGRAVTSACRPIFPTPAGRSAAMWRPRPASGGRSATPDFRPRSWCPAGFTASTRPKESCGRRGRHHRLGAPEPRRPGLDAQGAPRPWRPGAGCEYTNYCEGLDQKHKQVTCQLWDRIDRGKPGVAMTSDGKRRLVAPDWTPPET